MTVCLVAGLRTYYWLDRHEKNEKLGLGQTLIKLKFKSDLVHCLDTKKNIKDPDFPVLLITMCLGRSMHSLSALIWKV